MSLAEASSTSAPAPAVPFPYQRAAWDSLLDDLAERVADRVLERMAGRGEASRPEQLLTAREACRALNISRSSLDRLVAQGALTVTKVGACNRYPSGALDEYATGTSRSSA